MELFDYQKPHAAALYKALRNAACGVLDDSETGTGKTHTALWCAKQRGLPIGVICPPAVVSDWQEAAAAWGVELVFCTSYHKAIGKKFPYVRWTHKGKVAHWLEGTPPLIVFDEGHNMKRRTSRFGKLIRGVVHRSRSKALILTATPAETPLDLANNGEALGLHNGSSDFDFWAMRHGAIRGPHGGLVWKPALHRQPGLMGSIRQQLESDNLVHGMRWADAGLEHGQVAMRLWDMPDAAARGYREHHRELKAELEEPHLGIALRQHAELLKADEMAAMAVSLYEEGRHVVLFLNHTASIDRAAELLGAEVYDGRTKDKDGVKRRFQANESPYLVVQTQAGGAGMSLHDLHGVPRAALISPPWAAHQFRQILGRVDRANQVSLPVQTVVTARGTVEEKVGRALQRKQHNLAALLDEDLV